MKNAKKYISLLNKESNQNKKVNFYSQGYNYNSERRDLWTKKYQETNFKIYELEKNLTIEEKNFISEKVGVCFDWD